MVQSQVSPSWALRREERKGRGRAAVGAGGTRGSRGRSQPALTPTEGPSLRGLGRGRSVRLQDPSGEACWLGRRGPRGSRQARGVEAWGRNSAWGGDSRQVAPWGDCLRWVRGEAGRRHSWAGTAALERPAGVGRLLAVGVRVGESDSEGTGGVIRDSGDTGSLA